LYWHAVPINGSVTERPDDQGELGAASRGSGDGRTRSRSEALAQRPAPLRFPENGPGPVPKPSRLCRGAPPTADFLRSAWTMGNERANARPGIAGIRQVRDPAPRAFAEVSEGTT